MDGETAWIRLLLVSDTYTFPEESTTTLSSSLSPMKLLICWWWSKATRSPSSDITSISSKFFIRYVYQ